MRTKQIVAPLPIPSPHFLLKYIIGRSIEIILEGVEMAIYESFVILSYDTSALIQTIYLLIVHASMKQ